MVEYEPDPDLRDTEDIGAMLLPRMEEIGLIYWRWSCAAGCWNDEA